MKFEKLETTEAKFVGMYHEYINELYPGDIEYMSIDAAKENCDMWFDREQCEVLYINNDNGLTIGFCIIGHKPECHSKADWHIFGFYILPEYRRNHYGMFAVAELIHRYGTKASLHILTSNITGMLFWAKLAHMFGHHLTPNDHPELHIDGAVEYLID